MNKYKDSATADLNNLSKEMNQLSKSAPIIVNNSQQSNVASSGTTITSILSNKNADDTFLNLNTAGI
jgi:hypothetical protein